MKVLPKKANEKDQIIISKKDSQVFFDAISNSQKPSKTLKAALEDYKIFIARLNPNS